MYLKSCVSLVPGEALLTEQQANHFVENAETPQHASRLETFWMSAAFLEGTLLPCCSARRRKSKPLCGWNGGIKIHFLQHPWGCGSPQRPKELPVYPVHHCRSLQSWEKQSPCRAWTREGDEMNTGKRKAQTHQGLYLLLCNFYQLYSSLTAYTFISWNERWACREGWIAMFVLRKLKLHSISFNNQDTCCYYRSYKLPFFKISFTEENKQSRNDLAYHSALLSLRF